MAFVTWIKQLVVDFKIYLKINLIYPKHDKFKNIKSILPANIQLGDSVVIEEKVVFGSALKKIGAGVFIGNNTSFSYCTSIGSYSSISTGVKIGLVSHPLDYISTSPVFYSKRRGWLNQDIYDEKQNGYTEIGNDVLISANALILAGVKIGHGAVIAAGAFVNKDVPPYAIVAGMPAKLIRYRFEQPLVDQLLQSEWWLLPPQKLKKIVQYSNTPEVFLNKIKEL